MTRGRTSLLPATAVLALALALTGCSSGGAEDDPEPTGGSGGAAAPAPEPPDPYAVPAISEGGDLTVLGVLKGTLSQADQDALDKGQVVVTPELFLVIPGDNRMHALSRETGKLEWKTSLRRDDSDTGPCPLVSPPDGATAVVVFSGLQCGLIDAYSLEDGSRISRDEAPGGIGPSAEGPVRVAEQVFYADDAGVHSVLPDGSTELQVATAQLGLKGDYRSISGLVALAGSDVLMVRSDNSLGNQVADLVGMRVGEDGALEEAWRTTQKKALGPESLSGFASRPFMEGVVVDTIRKGIVTPRMITLDPETGERASTFVLQRDPPGGYPAWIEGKFPDEIQVDAERQVFSPAGDGGFGYTPHVVRYDVARNELAWDWTPRFGTDQAVSGKVMAVSEDREHVYALWTAYRESRLVELDYDTGRQQRVWQVPPVAADKVTSASGVMAGNQLVLFSLFGTKYDKAHAVVVEIGEPAAG